MEQTVPVTERALIQRINRKLHADGAKLRTAQGRAEAAMGRFYTVSFRKSCVLQRHVDLEAFGRQLGVFATYEHLEH